MGGRTDDPYFSSRRTRNILFGVLLVHIGVIAVPLIYSSLSDYFDPPLVVMKVGLADLPLGDSPDAGQPTQADTPSKTDPAPVDDLPDPTNVDPLPPEPKVQSKVDPPPQTKVDPPPQPKVEPTKNTQTKVDPPKTKTEQKKDPPPKSNILKPEDIKIKPMTKTQAQIDAEKKAAREAEEARRNAEKARQELIAGIHQDASQPGKFGTTDPGQNGILATKEMRDYYKLLTDFIHPKWTAVSPSTIELNGKIASWPVVELTIAKDGRVTKSVVVSASGNKKLDDAVKTLLADLKTVPVPPQAVRINVTLDIH